MATNITISTGGATTVVTVPEVQNNVTVSRNQITTDERTKLAGIEAGATADQSIITDDGLSGGASSGDVTLSVDNTVVRTTGNQSVAGTKTFDGPVTFNGGPNDPITIQNNTSVNFNNSSTTFGNGAGVIFSNDAQSPQFNAEPAMLLGRAGNQQILKNTPGELTVQSNSGDIKIVAQGGDLILKSGTSSGNKLTLEGRSDIEFKLARDQGDIGSVFKIIDTNSFSGDPTTVFEVGRAGDFTIRDSSGDEIFKVTSSQEANESLEEVVIGSSDNELFKINKKGDVVVKDQNNNVVFEVKNSDEENETIDFVRIGGPNGYKFPKVAPNFDLRNKALVVKDIADPNNPEFGEMEFRNFSAQSIFDLSEIDEDLESIGEGEALIWNDLTGKFVAQSVLSNVGLNDLSDVDTVTISPVDGYALVWNNGEWEPQAQETQLSNDLAPTLSANLDISTHSIVTTSSNQGITIQPHGTGNVSLGNFEFDADQSLSGKDNHVLTYDQGSGTIQLEPAALDLNGLSDVDLTGASEDDILIRDANGNFVPTDAFTAFMNAAVAATAGMPQNGSVAGDFDNDGIVSTNDLLIFLSNVGASPSDGNTQIEFTNNNAATFSIFDSNFTFENYNTQTSIVTNSAQQDMQQYEFNTPSVTTSIAPYTWQVNTASDSIKLYTSNSTEFGEWFENAVIEIKEPSSIYHNIGITTNPVSFAVYVEITRDYPTASNETDVKMIVDYPSAPENLNLLMTQDGPIFFGDAFKKDSGNTERPKAVTLKFYAAFAEDEFGLVQQRFNNLKLKVTGSV